MGFTCFICKEPFDAASKQSNNGAGDKQPERAVSATKCGHLFHATCLKRVFDAQSGNAWVAKLCPVCQEPLGIADIIRVHACAYDVLSAQKPSLEDVLGKNSKLQYENSELLKRLETSFVQYRAMHLDMEKMKRDKEENQMRFEQVVRLNAMYKSENDRYKTETDRLRNVIVSLSTKLTLSGDSQQREYSGISPNHGRQAYTDDMQGYDAQGFQRCAPTVLYTNERIPTPGHPPGLLYPMVARGTENTSETSCPNPGPLRGREGSQPTTSRNSNTSSINGSVQDVSNKSLPFEKGAMKSLFQQNTNALNFYHHDNGGYVKKTPRWDSVDNVFPAKTDESATSTKEPSVQTETGTNESPSSVNSTSDTMSIPVQAAKPPLKKSENLDDWSPLNLDDDLEEADDSGKWHEKRSRRRNSRQGGSRSNRQSSKMDFSGDKKLYGWYSCTTCNANWGSSQSILNKPQTCRYCKTEVHPHKQGPILTRRQLADLETTEASTLKK